MRSPNAIAIFIFSLSLVESALASSLGELEVRSYLGAPLNLRLVINAGPDEVLDAACFSIASATVNKSANDSAASPMITAAPAISRRDLRITLIETVAARYLQLRGQSGFNEPVSKLSVRMGCSLESATTRDYVVLLDPAPLMAAPVVTSVNATRSVSVADTERKDSSNATTVGQWQVYGGDTLAIIARGIYPQSLARRTQYIAALRSLNPALESMGDDAPLPLDMQLRLPDLKVLSGLAPSSVKAIAKSESAATTQQKPPAARNSDTERLASPLKSTPQRVVSQPKPVSKTALQIPTLVKPTPSSKPISTTKAAAKVATKAAAPAGGGFQLRLSGAEVDLSRSRGVTEAMRSELREKQLLLDADDQVAQLLSLKNTVKQLELRLNDMQSKLPGIATASRAIAPVAAPATEPAVVVAQAVAEPAPSIPVTPAAVFNPVVPSAPALAKPAPTSATSWRNSTFFGIPMVWLGGSLLLLVALITLILGARTLNQRRQKILQNTIPAPDENLTADAHTAPTSSIPDDAFFSHAGNVAVDNLARDIDVRDGFVPLSSYAAVIAAKPAETARFELDTAPVTTVDFLLGNDDISHDDHSRRLQYMSERYPELASKTVSIDDADSIINAARLYYEEAKTENSRDKACELLTFAIEERPQEIRFWLAQFEIYRLDNLAGEFSGLCSKFHVLFGHTDAWLKVRHVGHELDPTNPLFAAAGGASLASDRFDPMVENWLLAPMDFATDVLVGEMRQALFSENGVNPLDIEKMSATLMALHDSANLPAARGMVDAVVDHAAHQSH